MLVVEDEIPLLEAIKTKLEHGGFQVITARTAEQAAGYMEDVARVDAIWLDHYLLGQASGLDFLVKCKSEDSGCRNVPVFVVSNTASRDKVQAYLKLGVNKYYVKAEHRLDEIVGEIKKAIEAEE